MKKTLSRLRTAWPLAGISLALTASLASAQSTPAVVEATPAVAASTAETRSSAPEASNAAASVQGGKPHAAAEEAEERPEEARYDEAPLQVGDAATSLLAWQRDGAIASPTARPIAGDVARRSYERYLKSFEYPIPERLNSTVKTGSNSSSTTR